MPVARPQGVAPRPGLSPARAAVGRSGRQPARCRPKATVPAHTDDVQRHHLRRAATAMAQMGQRRGLGHPFEKKDDPTPLIFENLKDCPHVQNSKNTLNNSGNLED
ncbi:hypothetical protein B296_00048488 [Ensete ventricosum]|uniref:Uncharacterized protein n=1 Tax=Ensete ventricosum TaxID=4639 RepID=A0A426Y1B6_ENSVE|nr:hypothetical protein B296_00048488 [Ensete ventricosum]